MRLSTKLKPTEYNLALHPDYKTLDNYTGSVDISCIATEDISEFFLHADRNSVTIKRLTIETPTEEWKLDLDAAIYDENNFIYKFPFDDGRMIPKGKVLLHFDFSGQIRADMTGFYSSTYNPQESDKAKHVKLLEKYPLIVNKLVTTQFEALYARRAFPCFDEPSFKATFKVLISIPQELSHDVSILSNMPIESQTEVQYDSDNRTLVKFEGSPKMSTYLLAWTIGILEKSSVETKSKNYKQRTVSVYTVPGRIESAAFSLTVATKSLTFFEDLFNIDFPLPKLDLIAIPDFNHGAMENWGLITFRELYMLVDTQTSFSLRRDIAVTVAHEVGHMWFGNLVTMAWWDGLWLNEGFATFVMNEAAAFALKNETIREDLLAVESVQAYRDDSLSFSKPIEQEINKIEDISQMFDSIRYAKGGTVLRMLSEWAGMKAFGAALSVYLTKYEYDNATSTQLFEVLEQELKLPIVSMMNSFVMQPGVPLIKVTVKQNGIELQQSRFLNVETEDNQIWKLPIFIKTIGNEINEEIITMGSKTMHHKVEDLTICIANNKENGYYVTQYSDELLERIVKGIENIDYESVLKVFRDLVLLVKYRKIKLKSVLDFIENCLGNTKHPFILSEIISFVFYWKLFDSEKAKTYLSNYLYKNKHCKAVLVKYLNLTSKGNYSFTPLYDNADNRAGISNKDEEFQKMFEQSTLEGLSCCAKSTNQKEDLESIINNLENSKQVPNSLLKIIYDNYVMKDVEILFKIYEKTEISEKKRIVLRSLGLSKTEDIEKVLEFVKSDKLKMQDKFIVFCSLLTRNDDRSQIAQLILEEKSYLNNLYKSSSLLGRIASSFSVFYGDEDVVVLKALFGENPNIEAEYNRALEKIENNKLFSEFYESDN